MGSKSRKEEDEREEGVKVEEQHRIPDSCSGDNGLMEGENGNLLMACKGGEPPSYGGALATSTKSRDLVDTNLRARELAAGGGHEVGSAARQQAGGTWWLRSGLGCFWLVRVTTLTTLARVGTGRQNFTAATAWYKRRHCIMI